MRSSNPASRLVLYVSCGPELAWYDVDVDQATLARRGSVTLPANIQYAWPHTSNRYLYVTSSDSASGHGGYVGHTHHVSAFRIDPASGALLSHGKPLALPARPIHNTVDSRSEYLLTAYNLPSSVTVHRIDADGMLGQLVAQPEELDTGIYAHQIRVAPNNRLAVLVTRGNDPSRDKPEEPGALKVLRFENGFLKNNASVAPNSGYGFGPRHLDFHPTRSWIYVSLERQHKLTMFTLEDDVISPEPAYVRDLLAEPNNVRPRQFGGTVHVHPGGRFVYAVNRSDHRIDSGGHQVFGGGENSIVVHSIDQDTGEPTLVERVPTHGFHARTFSLDPQGRLLVAAHTYPMKVLQNGCIVDVPPTLSVFRVERNGSLTYIRQYTVDSGEAFVWWSGMIEL